MQIEISGHAHAHITDEIRHHVTDKGDHLVRIFDGITTLHVIFHVENKDRIAEFVANVSHSAPVVAKAAAPTFHAAIDLAAEKIETQLRRHKEKVRDHRAHDHVAEAARPVASGEEEEDETPGWEDEADTSGQAPSSF